MKEVIRVVLVVNGRAASLLGNQAEHFCNVEELGVLGREGLGRLQR
jgi:hypothetical protein